jgi:hypothetical protein
MLAYRPEGQLATEGIGHKRGISQIYSYAFLTESSGCSLSLKPNWTDCHNLHCLHSKHYLHMVPIKPDMIFITSYADECHLHITLQNYKIRSICVLFHKRIVLYVRNADREGTSGATPGR